MATAIFPTLPGMTLDVEKTPNWATRMQRSVSGRELRISDYRNPIWHFTLSFDFLRDKHDTRAGPGVGEGVGFDELRTLMGFFNQQQGAAIPFLFFDPSDSTAIGQTLPPATSTVATALLASGGSGYSVGDTVYLGDPAQPVASAQVTAIGAGGSVTGIALGSGGSYTDIPGTSGLPTSSLIGTGLTLNVTWRTSVQLVRTLTGGGTENVLPNQISAIYYNGIPQTGFQPGFLPGQVILPAPVSAPNTVTQPVITADFSYVYLVRFTKDAAQFKQFCYQLWELKQIELTSLVIQTAAALSAIGGAGSPTAGGAGGTGGGTGGATGGSTGTPPTISITPSTPTILSTTPLGGVVATITVTNSNGSPFAGTLFFTAPHFDAGGVFAISGNTIIVNPNGPGVGGITGTVTDFITVDATP